MGCHFLLIFHRLRKVSRADGIHKIVFCGIVQLQIFIADLIQMVGNLCVLLDI